DAFRFIFPLSFSSIQIGTCEFQCICGAFHCILVRSSTVLCRKNAACSTFFSATRMHWNCKL
ncbi:unnamed protein product, partial [Staurois parvus]